MDPLDILQQSENTAELGIALQDAPTIPPEFMAGNRLSDELEIAEKIIHPSRLADILQGHLDNRQLPSSILLAPLCNAIRLFRDSVTPAIFEQRLKARIARLRG